MSATSTSTAGNGATGSPGQTNGTPGGTPPGGPGGNGAGGNGSNGPGTAGAGPPGGNGAGTGNHPPPPPPPPVYVPQFFTGQLPAAEGVVAKTIDATPKDVQRQKAAELFDFFKDASSQMSALNEEGHIYTCLMAVPDTHDVRVVHSIGFGTRRIGNTSTVTDKFLALHGEGNADIGPPRVLVLPDQIITDHPVKCPTDAEVEAAFATANHTVTSPVAPARNVNTDAAVLQLVPFPAYLVYDGFKQDLPAAEVYERARGCQHPAPWLEHAIMFLRSCLVGTFRNQDHKPYVDRSVMNAIPTDDARRWANQRFKKLFPTAQPQQQHAATTGGPVQVQHGVGGANASVFNFDPAMLQYLLQIQQSATATTPTRATTAATEEKKDDGKLKVSELEKKKMRVMCGLPEDSEAFPKWYLDLFAEHQDEKDKMEIVSNALKATWIFDDAEVPVYSVLLKTVVKRDWTASDLGLRPAYANAAKGLSPFGMLDLTLDDIANMTEEDFDLSRASHVTAAEYKAARTKLKAKVPANGEELLLMLKRFGNLLFALFTRQSPMYKQLRTIIDAIKRLSLNARKGLPHNVRAAILWIVLLQARKFGNGEMQAGADDECLGAFTNLKNQLAAMSIAGISHADMPDELRIRPTEGQQGGTGGGTSGGTSGGKGKRKHDDNEAEEQESPGKKRDDLLREPYSQEMASVITRPWEEANKPGVAKICTYCGVTKADLLPDFSPSKDCLQWLLFGKCWHKGRCKYHHRTATRKQVEAINDKWSRFITDPDGCKAAGKKE